MRDPARLGPMSATLKSFPKSLARQPNGPGAPLPAAPVARYPGTERFKIMARVFGERCLTSPAKPEATLKAPSYAPSTVTLAMDGALGDPGHVIET
ncbi:MAG: hypothetical protein LBF58_09325 [Deltaproteobacteria bacterium]|jgi:hypothetical protein|nr:hypothetical protein [Deltaproteobacteria bacterium]